MARNWTDLGEVLSGRDLAEGERVTMNVFDAASKTLLEQVSFRPARQQHSRYVWIADFCRYINTHSALIRAGKENDNGDWDVLGSGYQNHYWSFCSRALKVVTTVAHKENWSTANRVAIHSGNNLAAGAVIRVNVRGAAGELLETVTFTPSATRLTPGLWTKDLAIQINNTSLFVRAGRANEHLLQPWHEGAVNYIWIPQNSDLSVTWSVDELKDGGKILADRDALDGERISLLVFDDLADKPLDRITLTAYAAKNRLKKDQWPADLAKQINASSGHAKAGERSAGTFTPRDSATSNVICQRYAELRTFTTALHLDNWVQGDTLLARGDLGAADCILVKVFTASKGNFCEALTFTPDPGRLRNAQWAHDLAVHINKYSFYLKAGVKNTTSKLIAPQENASSNLIWLPKDCGLKVNWDVTQMKNLGYISSQRELRVNEGCKAFVLDDGSDEILRELTFSATSGRTGTGYAPKDLASWINGRTQLIVAGERKGNARPAPVASSYLNTLWGCKSDIRAFTTFMSLNNWDKGALMANRDLVDNEQVVVIVKGKKSGRILESMNFIPKPGRYSRHLWGKDLSLQLNTRSRFIRGGEENTTLFLMEPMHKVDVNHFWTPKGSGLEVEMHIISGIAMAWPGMSSEARELFEQCVESKKHIDVDAQTGKATLMIPIVKLFADDSLLEPLKLNLVYDKDEVLYIKLGDTLATYNKDDLPLRDGRRLRVGRNAEVLNGGDFKLEPILQPGLGLAGASVSFLSGYRVLYKDGGLDTYSVGGAGASIYPQLTRYTTSSGGALEISYSGGLKSVVRGATNLLSVEWSPKIGIDQTTGTTYLLRMPASIVVFPDSPSEKKTFTFTQKSDRDRKIKFEVNGLGAAGKTSYTITQDDAGRLTGLEIEQQHKFTVDGKEVTDKALYRETLEYTADGKVSRHVIAPGGDMDALVHDYAYAGTATTLVGYYKTAAPRTAFVRNYNFSNGHSFVENYGSEAVPLCKERVHRLDSDSRRVVSQTRVWEGDVLVDQQDISLDAVGNVVRRSNNDEIVQCTYYNNYQQFRVTETRVRVEDWTLFGCLFKGLDYINPVGAVFALGGSGGMTWGTRIDTKVEMSPALNNYAKAAFNLPVDITHCGSSRPFSGEMESELVSRRIGDKEVAQRLTFFGYEMVEGRVRAKRKLVILQPDCSTVDVTAEQLAVAKKAAESFIRSLNEQIAAASSKEKPAYEQALKDLNASLDAQSKTNSQGFRLNSKKDASMYLETYEYQTDKNKAGYGQLASSETVQLAKSGALVEGSAVKTSYAYSVDAADANRLTIKTTVSRSGDSSIVSSQTRSLLTGRLLESTDSEGNKTVRSYDPQGHLKSETLSQGSTERRKTTCSLTRNLVWQYDMLEDKATTRITRDAVGRKVSQALKPEGATSWLETHRWTYDLCGRTASVVETDYGAGNAKIAQREIRWAYDVSGKITSTHLLRDGKGVELKKVIQERTPGVRGERLVQGKFSVDRQFNPGKNLMTERYALSGGEGCRIERSMSAEGLMKSIRYLRIEAGNKETEQDKLDFSYDDYAQLTKATPKLSGVSSYTYDAAGRLLSTTREGIVLSNIYDPKGLSSVASEGKVKQGSTEQSLGTQASDLLGRAINQTIGGQKTEFSYSGASTRSTLKTVPAGPPALSGYKGEIDRKTRTHTQKVGSESSSLVFSTGGRVISFTDLTGAVTTYEYDFFDRLTASRSEHCVCTWTYADNGLLTSETVKAVKSGNLEMKVDYVHDGLGQEIRRTFTCTGVSTLSVERTLLGDGRLSKSVVKAAGTQKHADSYEYDKSMRLSKWVESGGRSDTYAYDALGNLPSQAGTLDSSGRLTVEGNRRISYHANGQVNTYSTDADKNKYTFSYDDEGRVRGGSIGTRSDTYHYRGDCVYALVQTDTATGASFARRSLVVRNESRACLLQDAKTGAAESRSFELRDANGTVFASVDLGSKAISYFRYEPYGKRHSGGKAETWLGFKGEPLNSLELYYLGSYRLYDPSQGRFLSRDSKSPFGAGGAGGYVFCNADPVNFEDPSGHEVVAQYSRWGSAPAIQSTAFRIIVGAVGVLLAPFTAGASMLLAVATTALAAISFAFDVASIIISESDPQLSRTLEAWGQVFGIASAAAGFAMTAHGFKSIPRKWFSTRGGPSVPFKVDWPKVPSELRIAQQARSKALNQLIQFADEAKAAGKYDAFKAKYLSNGGAGAAGGLAQGTNLDMRFNQRAIASTRNFFKGTIRQFDDSLADYLGITLDFYSGPNVLIQKFIPPLVSETEIKSLVALPMPGRENLFP